jgi:ABC-type sugar transport system permease subunit
MCPARALLLPPSPQLYPFFLFAFFAFCGSFEEEAEVMVCRRLGWDLVWNLCVCVYKNIVGLGFSILLKNEFNIINFNMIKNNEFFIKLK